MNIMITATEIDAKVSAWIAANQTGKRRPGIARIAEALGYARLTVKASVERIERVATAAEPAAHRAYCRNHTLSCTCAEFGRDHVAPLEVFDAPPPAAKQTVKPDAARPVVVTPVTIPFNPAGAAQTAAAVNSAASIAAGTTAASVPAEGAPVTETTEQSLAVLERITAVQDERRAARIATEIRADIERRAARIANVLSDWKGKEIVLASGRIVTVGEHRHNTVRLIRTTGPNAGDSAWYPAEEIWQGLENGTILTPDQPTAAPARREVVAMLDAMLTHPTRTPESIAYVARAALRVLAEANGADSLSGLALAELDRRHPARYITVDAGNGIIWHLVDGHGKPVEAGEYADFEGDRFMIEQHPDATWQGDSWMGQPPTNVAVKWADNVKPLHLRGRISYFAPSTLVHNWEWQAERV